MNILHIVAYYPRTKVHMELFDKIDKRNNGGNKIKQIIFIPRRNIKGEENKSKLSNKNIEYVYFKKFKKIESMLYYPRIRKSFKNLEQNVDLTSIDIIHAHCLFADGGIALKVKKKYNIDYVVSIRMDTKQYLKKMPHATIKMREILINAKKIIVIAPNILDEIYKRFNKKDRDLIKSKILIAQNGINEFWYKNINNKKMPSKNTIKFLQVSEFIKRKNIDKSIKIIEYLNKNEIKCELTVIGNGSLKEKIKKKVKKRNISNIIKIEDATNNKQELLKKYRETDIFIMPSDDETFGLVYPEAMTQGLPIIYKKDTGISPFLSNDVGFGIYKFKYDLICDKIKLIIQKYEYYSENSIKECGKYKWNNVGNLIFNSYK